MLASPAMEPTDRSMPPVRITNVTPMARIALMATCLVIRIRLLCVRYSEEIALKKMTRITIARPT